MKNPHDQLDAMHLTDWDSARESAIQLQRHKQLVGAARDSRFIERIDRLWGTSLEENGTDLLKGLALLFRIGAVAKHTRSHFEALAAQVVRAPSKVPQELSDSDDRRYLGEGLRFSSGPWKAAYLAKAAVEEVSGEEARVHYISALLLERGELSACINDLRTEFSTWEVETQDTGASRARRMTRVVAALKRSVIENDPALGEGFGIGLLEMARAATGGEQIADENAKVQAAEALLDLLSTAIRFHFSISSDVETYSIIGLVRRWFPSDNPPEELASILASVGKQALEAIIFLAKQGVPNDQLRRTFLLIAGEGRGSAELQTAGREVPGVSAELRRWLVVGRLPRESMATNDAVDETILRAVDKDVASLFRETTELDATLDRIVDDLPASMSSYEPQLVPSVRRLVDGLRRVSQRVNLLAARRQMRFGSAVGEQVEFNPVDHELPSGDVSGIVRVKRPSVVRVGDAVAPIVVLKAEVEGGTD